MSDQNKSLRFDVGNKRVDFLTRKKKKSDQVLDSLAALAADYFKFLATLRDVNVGGKI